VAARLRSVIYARHESRLRAALIAWHACAHAPTHVAHLPYPLEEEGEEEDEAGGTVADAGSVLEVVFSHLRPAALQWAINEWVRSMNYMFRAASWNAALEGKFALQKAVVLEGQSREQLIRGVLRWWSHGHLARVFAQWAAVSRIFA
jgi:hypothetical protein